MCSLWRFQSSQIYELLKVLLKPPHYRWYNHHKTQQNQTVCIIHDMMTSSNGNIFRVVTGPLCGEFTGDRWRGALMFSLIHAWINDWLNNRGAGDLRRHRAHCDVIVMKILQAHQTKCFSMKSLTSHIMPRNTFSHVAIVRSALNWKEHKFYYRSEHFYCTCIQFIEISRVLKTMLCSLRYKFGAVIEAIGQFRTEIKLLHDAAGLVWKQCMFVNLKLSFSLETVSWHDANIAVTSLWRLSIYLINENRGLSCWQLCRQFLHQRHQWQLSGHHDNSRLSVYDRYPTRHRGGTGIRWMLAEFARGLPIMNIDMNVSRCRSCIPFIQIPQSHISYHAVIL